MNSSNVLETLHGANVQRARIKTTSTSTEVEITQPHKGVELRPGTTTLQVTREPRFGFPKPDALVDYPINSLRSLN